LDVLRNLHSRETIERWQALATGGDWPTLVNELLAQHYDALYKRSQSLHFTGLDTPQTLTTDDLTPAGVDVLAQQICGN
jgi:tRNA 2-selenouridine synthase